PWEREPMNNEPRERDPIDRVRARLEALLKANDQQCAAHSRAALARAAHASKRQGHGRAPAQRSRRSCQRCVWCAEPSGAARIRAAERAYFANYRQRWPDYSPVGRAEWNHRMVNNMKSRKQKAPPRQSPPRARRLTRPRKRSAAMKRSGEWRSSMLTARSFAKL